MAEKYFPINTYAYCAGNPVNLVDYNGMDIWEVDDKGRIVSHTENKEIDTIYLVNKDDKGNITRRTDDDGNEISISFEYGTIEKTRSITFSPDGKTVDTYDIIQVRGDSNGTNLFETFFILIQQTQNHPIKIKALLRR